jgi:DNA-binding transcriptional LysR family regulator
LTGHDCINLRLPTHGGLYAWEFEEDGRELRVRLEGQLVLNGTTQILNAAQAGFGLAYGPEDLASPISPRLVSSPRGPPRVSLPSAV